MSNLKLNLRGARSTISYGFTKNTEVSYVACMGMMLDSRIENCGRIRSWRKKRER